MAHRKDERYKVLFHLKGAGLPKLVYIFNIIPIKIPTNFVDVDRLILKIIWRCKRPRGTSTVLKEKNEVRGLI